MFLNDLYALFIYLILAFCISYIAFLISYLLGVKVDDLSKLLSYECGFTPFNDARDTFEIHYYITAILFLMFDLEISFLFSWSVSLSFISIIGFIAMSFLFVIIFIEFIYGYKKGILEW